jgi:hypothetical protein
LLNHATNHTQSRCGAFKKNIVSLKKIHFLPILLMLISCNQKQKQIDTWNERIAEFEETKNSESEIKKQDFKKIVAEFSEQYVPKRSANFDSIPNEIIKAFKELRTIDNVAHEKYVTLIFAKLYAEHLECCHQGYIIANRFKNDFDKDKLSMINEFAYISNYVDYSKLPEAWSSGIIEKWIKENPKFLNDKQIKREIDRINVETKNIADGIYWKN